MSLDHLLDRTKCIFCKKEKLRSHTKVEPYCFTCAQYVHFAVFTSHGVALSPEGMALWKNKETAPCPFSAETLENNPAVSEVVSSDPL